MAREDLIEQGYVAIEITPKKARERWFGFELVEYRTNPDGGWYKSHRVNSVSDTNEYRGWIKPYDLSDSELLDSGYVATELSHEEVTARDVRSRFIKIEFQDVYGEWLWSAAPDSVNRKSRHRGWAKPAQKAEVDPLNPKPGELIPLWAAIRQIEMGNEVEARWDAVQTWQRKDHVLQLPFDKTAQYRMPPRKRVEVALPDGYVHVCDGEITAGGRTYIDTGKVPSEVFRHWLAKRYLKAHPEHRGDIRIEFTVKTVEVEE